MSKEIINHVCRHCESSFKLSYDPDEVTSLPKFCPFCEEETLAELIEDDQGEVDFGTYEEEDPQL